MTVALATLAEVDSEVKKHRLPGQPLGADSPAEVGGCR